MFGDRIASRMVKIQNRELTFRVIACNMHRLTVFMDGFYRANRENYPALT